MMTGGASPAEQVASGSHGETSGPSDLAIQFQPLEWPEGEFADALHWFCSENMPLFGVVAIVIFIAIRGLVNAIKNRGLPNKIDHGLVLNLVTSALFFSAGAHLLLCVLWHPSHLFSVNGNKVAFHRVYLLEILVALGWIVSAKAYHLLHHLVPEIFQKHSHGSPSGHDSPDQVQVEPLTAVANPKNGATVGSSVQSAPVERVAAENATRSDGPSSVPTPAGVKVQTPSQKTSAKSKKRKPPRGKR